MIICQFKRTVQQSFQINLLMDHLTGRRRLALVDKIPSSKLVRRKTCNLRNLIQVSFKRENALWGAKPTERALRWCVGRHGSAIDSNIWTSIWTGRMNGSAGENHR